MRGGANTLVGANAEAPADSATSMNAVRGIMVFIIMSRRALTAHTADSIQRCSRTGTFALQSAGSALTNPDVNRRRQEGQCLQLMPSSVRAIKTNRNSYNYVKRQA